MKSLPEIPPATAAPEWAARTASSPHSGFDAGVCGVLPVSSEMERYPTGNIYIHIFINVSA